MPMLCCTSDANFPAHTRSKRYHLRMRSSTWLVELKRLMATLGIQYLHTHKLPNHVVLREDKSGPHFDLQDFFTPNHCGQPEVRADRNEDEWEWPTGAVKKSRRNLSLSPPSGKLTDRLRLTKSFAGSGGMVVGRTRPSALPLGDTFRGRRQSKNKGGVPPMSPGPSPSANTVHSNEMDYATLQAFASLGRRQPFRSY
ncbi:hypothetical protein B296_00021095 [Ensete ventricosum]|uniref:Uncharacterized protein n=1 Tax=Ensete ventricosum TaxID=4639 RepID=A0A426Z930_ENSVE|nr:hypothetical protein B296_00021095 [Ensete ventricosum]